MTNFILENATNIIIAVIMVSLFAFYKMIANNRKITIESKDIYVIDGDTFSVKGTATRTGERLRIRPIGFDAPELKQRGGKEAKKALQAKLRAGATLHIKGKDRYGRALAEVTTPKGRLAKLMMATGHAHSDDPSAFVRFFKTLPARLRGKGMWKGTFLGLGVQRPVNHRRFNQNK